jgi:hypothetical protein
MRSLVAAEIKLEGIWRTSMGHRSGLNFNVAGLAAREKGRVSKL